MFKKLMQKLLAALKSFIKVSTNEIPEEKVPEEPIENQKRLVEENDLSGMFWYKEDEETEEVENVQ